MANKSILIWIILETFIRAMISIGIITLLSRYITDIVLYVVIALFAWWVFTPLYHIYNLSRKNRSKRKRKR